MIDHSGIDVSDIEAAVVFYNAALAPQGPSLLSDIPLEFTDGAFMRDPDGNNIEAVCYAAEIL